MRPWPRLSIQSSVYASPCAERLEAGRLVLDVGGLDVEVHPVLDGLGFEHCLEEELGSDAVRVDEHHVLAGAPERGVAERFDQNWVSSVGSVQSSTSPIVAVMRYADDNPI